MKSVYAPGLLLSHLPSCCYLVVSNAVCAVPLNVPGSVILMYVHRAVVQ